MEIVVSDDGSNDGSWEMINSAVEQYRLSGGDIRISGGFRPVVSLLRCACQRAKMRMGGRREGERPREPEKREVWPGRKAASRSEVARGLRASPRAASVGERLAHAKSAKFAKF